MKETIFIISLLLLVVIKVNAQEKDFPKLSGPYLGQKPPGIVPEIFAPGIISTQNHEFSCCLSPDGKEFYFTRMNPEERQNYVMFTIVTDNIWTEPAVAPFAGTFTFEPFITPDNKRVYFQTGKVVEGKLLMYTMYAERTDKGWSEAKDPGEPFNPMKTMHISSTMDGTIYTTDISGGMGSESLGIIRYVNGNYQKLEKLGSPFNKTEKQQHPWIAPDESYIIFTVRRPGQNPVSVLFCSFKNKSGEWSEPVELNLGMDAGQPFVSFDGKYLFFTSGDPKVGSDIYWVSTKIINDLRPKE
jgi:Tol biopolymer transport system component